MNTPEQQQTNTEFGDIVFPPMPESLRQLWEEKRKEEPDARRISAIIQQDVALASEVLKTVNSPAFARGKSIASLDAAVLMLGIPRTLNIASSIIIRSSSFLAGERQRMERFWDTAGDVAYASSRYAWEYTGLSPDMAYSLGLLHDCGIPVMMQRFPVYGETMKWMESNPDGDLVAREEESFPFNHARLGAHLSKHWCLPEMVSEAIRWHHHFPELLAREAAEDETLLSMIAVLNMASHTSRVFRNAALDVEYEDREWERQGDVVLSFLDIETDGFEDMKRLMLQELGQR